MHSSRFWFVRLRACCAALCIAAALPALPGCGSGETGKASPESKTAENAGGSTPADEAKEANDRCESLVSNAVDMMQPDRLEISSSTESAVDVLNNWAANCGAGAIAAAAGETTAIDRLLSEEQKQSLKEGRFDARDAQHIRDCLIDRIATDAVVKESNNDLDRVVRLFHYVSRNIALERITTGKIPLVPYETLILGHGAPEDRAWIFANMLRQLNLDAVILRPAGAASADASSTGTPPAEQKPDDKEKSGGARPGEQKPADKPWLVGVLLDKQVYLFDMKLGWPVPSPADQGQSPLVQQPATLAEVLADDGLLRRLDVGVSRPYGLRAEDLKSLRVDLISDSRFWSSRMQALQNILPPVGGRSVVIFDGLGDAGGGKGLLTRVTEAGAGAWTAEQISVWPYPESCWVASHKRDKGQLDKLELLWLPYQATVSVEFDPGQMAGRAGEPTRVQLKTRTSQILGDNTAAIKSYLTVQLSEYPQRLPIPAKIVETVRAQLRAQGRSPAQMPAVYPVPRDVWAMHARATDDAKFWTCLLQFEMGEYRAAAESSQTYLKRYKNAGTWSGSASVLRAVALAHDGNYREAVLAMNQALQMIADDHPQRVGYELLNARWRALRGEGDNSADDAPADPPAKENAPAKEDSASKEDPAAKKTPEAKEKPASDDPANEKPASPDETPPKSGG